MRCPTVFVVASVVTLALVGSAERSAHAQFVGDRSMCAGQPEPPCTGACRKVECICPVEGGGLPGGGGGGGGGDPVYMWGLTSHFMGWFEGPFGQSMPPSLGAGICVLECVSGIGPAGTGGCDYVPPGDGPGAICAGDLPPLEPVLPCELDPACDPDPNVDRISVPGWNSLPGVSADCQAAEPGDWWEKCEQAFLEHEDGAQRALLQNWGWDANRFCQGATSEMSCQDGVYCDYTDSRQTTCTICDDGGDCYRYRTHGGAGDDGGEPPAEENDGTVTLGQIAEERCDGTVSCGWTPEGDLVITHPDGTTETISKDQSKPNLPAPPQTPAQDTTHDRESNEPRDPADRNNRDGHPDDEPVIPATTTFASGQPAAPNRGRNAAQTGSLRKLKILIRNRPNPKVNTKTETKALDPVHLASGQLVDAVIDLEIEARQADGLHFRLERFYDSGGISQGVLGRNWWHSYEEKVVPIDERFPGVSDLPHYCVEALPIVNCVAHEYAPGRAELYLQDPATHVFHPSPGGDAVIVFDPAPADKVSRWVMRNSDGLMSGFDPRGRLRWQRDRRGDDLHFWYGADDGDQLRVVVDPLQRLIRFDYDVHGRLDMVTDFAGRTVRYDFLGESSDLIVPARPHLNTLHAMLEGLNPPPEPPRHHLLTAVTQAAPAMNGVPARYETWRLEYLTEAEIFAAVRPPLDPPPSNDPCGDSQDNLEAWAEWELQVASLTGNLVRVFDPSDRLTLENRYVLVPGDPAFDRIVAQSWGDTAGTTFATLGYIDDPAQFGSVPTDVRAGLNLALPVTESATACDALALQHVGKILRIGGATVPAPALPPLDLSRLSTDSQAVCSYTQVTDRAGVQTWFGLNFRGQTVLEAQLRPTSEGGGAVYTVVSYDFAGRPTVTLQPDGARRTWAYDQLSRNPLSRNNLLVETEVAGPAGAEAGAIRTRTWSYEPLFNQALLETDTLGRQTRHYVDYQELDVATGETLVLDYLTRWGSTATDLGLLAPELDFGVGDLNGDQITDRVRGDEIYTWRPVAILASGASQVDFAYVQYNEFSQPTYVYQAGGRWAYFDYQPAAGAPTGTSVTQSSTFLASALPGQRDARRNTGGLLVAVRTTLQQPVSSGMLAGQDETPVEQRFEYDLLGQVVRERDLHGRGPDYARDGFGDLRRLTDEAGFVTEWTYDGVGDLVAIAEGIDTGSVNRARRTYLAWSVGGNLLAECVESIAGACGGGSHGAILAARANPGASVTTHAYDLDERRVATTDPEGHTSTVSLDSRGLSLIETAGGGLEPIESSFDDAGRLMVTWNGAGDAHSFEYDGFGRVILERRPNLTEVHHRWDLADRLIETRIAAPDGTMLSRTRYAHDQRDRAWQVRRWWQVPAGQLAQPGQADEQITTLELGIDGQPVAITSPGGATSTLAYDSTGRLEAVFTPGGDAEYWYREPSTRRLLGRRDESGHDRWSETTFDGRGRPLTSSTADPVAGISHVTRSEWDGLDNRLAQIDAQGNRRTWSYDLAGRTIASAEPSEERGAADRTSSYAYDRRGLMTRMVDPEGVVTTQVWTPAGHLQSEIAGRQHKAHYYDAAGRWRAFSTERNDQLSVRWTDGQVDRIDGYSPIDGWAVRTFARDGLGRPIQAVHYGLAEGIAAIHVTRRIYDSLDRVLEEGTQLYRAGATWLDPIPNNEHVVRSAWDADGGLATLQYPDGTRVDTVRDAQGQPVDLSWDGGGGHASLVWEGGALINMDVEYQGSWLSGSHVMRDAFGRAIGLDTQGPQGTVFAEQRSLDPLGRVREQAQTWSGASRTRAFEYDGAGALRAAWSTSSALAVTPLTSNADVASAGSARWGASRRSFERDRTGTLLAERTGPVTHYEARGSSPAGHELGEILAPAGVAIAHDTLGRVSTDGRSDFQWNAFGNLTRATDRVTGAHTDYIYDGFGRRVAKTADGVTEEHVWAGWNRIAVLHNGAYTGRAIFGPGWDHPIEVDVDGVAYFPVRDLQGSVVAALDADGTVVESYQYDAYGNLTILDADGAVTCEDAPPAHCQPIVEHGYTGQLRDDETGLYYYKHRYYSPALRTFLSRDPLGYVDGPDLWQYVAGDPINRVDVDGRSWEWVRSKWGGILDVFIRIPGYDVDIRVHPEPPPYRLPGDPPPAPEPPDYLPEGDDPAEAKRAEGEKGKQLPVDENSGKTAPAPPKDHPVPDGVEDIVLAAKLAVVAGAVGAVGSSAKVLAGRVLLRLSRIRVPGPTVFIILPGQKKNSEKWGTPDFVASPRNTPLRDLADHVEPKKPSRRDLPNKHVARKKERH